MKMDEPWLTQQFNEGERVELYDTNIYAWPERISTSNPLEGTVVGTTRNKFRRINYVVELPDGSRRECLYEFLRKPSSSLEQRQRQAQRMREIYKRIVDIADSMDNTKREELLSQLEQLCDKFKPQ